MLPHASDPATPMEEPEETPRCSCGPARAQTSSGGEKADRTSFYLCLCLFPFICQSFKETYKKKPFKMCYYDNQIYNKNVLSVEKLISFFNINVGTFSSSVKTE